MAARSRSGVRDGASVYSAAAAGQHPLLQLRRAVGQQHEPGRRDVQRQPAGDPGVVDDRVAGRQPLDEQHLLAVADRRAGRGARRRRAGPRGTASPHRAASSVGDARDASSHIRIPMRTSRSGPRASRPWLDQLGDEPRRRGHVQAGPAGDLGDRQRRLVRGEASRMRTARASEDSPVAVRAIVRVWQRHSHPLRGCFLGHTAAAARCRHDSDRPPRPRRWAPTSPRSASPAKTVVADDVLTLELAAPSGGRLRDWTPGSHIDLVLPNGLTRQYSLCGDRWDAVHLPGRRAPRAGRAAAAPPSCTTSWQWATSSASAARATTSRSCPSEQYLFVAGGIGITPMLPMIAQADLLGADWRLLYGGRRAGLDGLPRRARGVRRPRPGRAPGRVRPARPARFLGEPRPASGSTACGPGPLLAAMEADLRRLAAAHPAHRAVRGRGAGRAGARPPVRRRARAHRRDGDRDPGHDGARGAARRSGSRCCPPAAGASAAPARPTVLAGEPDHRDSLLDDDERDADDCMYICVSRSCTDRLVLDL